MKLKDDAMATYETIKEDAKDICYEAKAKNEGEQIGYESLSNCS